MMKNLSGHIFPNRGTKELMSKLMTTKTISRTFVSLFLVGVFVIRAQAAPNVVVIIADDQTWSDAGCYGSEIVKTPNIDSLASAGLRFDRAFTATAMCAPTRQQLYTGLFPVKSGAFPNHSKVKVGTKSLVHYYQDAGYSVGLCGKRHFGPPQSFPFETVSKGKLESFITQKDPFFLVYASNSPHLPWEDGDASAYDPDTFELPPYLHDNKETRAALQKYYAEITDFDRELGELDGLINDAGKADDTIFIYTSEQGAQFPFGKWTCYEVGLHVGLVIRWPGKIKAGSSSDAMVQYVDVLPTLLELCGLDIPKDLDGHSFAAVIEGRADQHNDYVFGVHTTRGIILGTQSYPVRSVRDTRFKLIRNLNHESEFSNVLIKGNGSSYWGSWVRDSATDINAERLVNRYVNRPAIELYDLDQDPYELQNLAGLPEYRKISRRLDARLKQWMAEQGDHGHKTEMTVKPHATMQ